MTEKSQVPIAALKRLGDDLNSSSKKSEIYEINRQRINDFISKPFEQSKYKPFKPSSSINSKTENYSHVRMPGIYEYPKSQEVDSIIVMQNKAEFQNCLGPKSRFGDGDGSLFDLWLVSYGQEKIGTTTGKRKGKHSYELPKLVSKSGVPMYGIKNHYMYHKSDPTGEERRSFVTTYEQRQKRNDLNINRERLEKESRIFIPNQSKDGSIVISNFNQEKMWMNGNSTNEHNIDIIPSPVDVPVNVHVHGLSMTRKASRLSFENTASHLRHNISREDLVKDLEIKQRSRNEIKYAFYEQYRDVQRQHLLDPILKQQSSSNIYSSQMMNTMNTTNTVSSSHFSESMDEPRPLYRRMSSLSFHLQHQQSAVFNRAESTTSNIQSQTINRKNSIRPVSPRTKFLNDCVSYAIDPPMIWLPADIDTNTVYHVSNQVITSDKLIPILANSLINITQLEYINISRNNITGEAMTSLLKVFTSNLSLKGLNISYNRMNNESYHHLFILVKQSAYLNELILRGLDIREENLQSILEAVKYRNSVEYLDLGENSLGMGLYNNNDNNNDSIGLKRKQTMTIDSFNNIKEDSSRNTTTISTTLSDYLSQSFCSIHTLILDWNRIRGSRIISLLKSLSENKSLTYLDLSSNNLSSDGGEWLGQAIESNNTLKHLKITKNNINPTACYVIMCGMRISDSLEDVDISDNPIGDVGMNSVIRLLIDYHNQSKKVLVNEISLHIKSYSLCWLESQLPTLFPSKDNVNSKTAMMATTTTMLSDNSIQYDLSNIYERAKCVERLHYLAMSYDYICDDKSRLSTITLRLTQKRLDSKNLDLEHDKDDSKKDGEDDIHNNLISDEIQILYLTTIDSSNNGSGNNSSNSDTNSDTNSSTRESILNEAKELFCKYDTKHTKCLSHEKIRLIVQTLLKNIKDNTIKNILSLHESLECGYVKENEFYEVISSVMERLHQAIKKKHMIRYYSTEKFPLNDHIKNYTTYYSPKKYHVPTSGIAQIILPKELE